MVIDDEFQSATPIRMCDKYLSIEERSFSVAGAQHWNSVFGDLK